jgi:hypothetical protein
VKGKSGLKMTLVLSVNRPKTIWMLVDRRLSYRGRPPKDDARKLMHLETTDGDAILGYAGPGATARGNEPADWMSNVLRGRNVTLEQSLGFIADAMKRELPKHLIHLRQIALPAHQIIVPSFVNGVPQLYSIDLVLDLRGGKSHFSYTRHRVDGAFRKNDSIPRIALGGSGGVFLLRRPKEWVRPLLRAVRAHDADKISALRVADELARINLDVASKIPGQSVGPNCIVKWQYRKEGTRNGGGGHQSYTGLVRDAAGPGYPTITRGTDLNALIEVMLPRIMKNFEALRIGGPDRELDTESINAQLAKLPHQPDERLR